MTKRSDVSATQNIYFDAQQLDADDLNLEQNYNNSKIGSLINNHIGSGILAETLDEKILFDSSLYAGSLDGVAINAQSQPSDNNYGNQIEVALFESDCAGKRRVKVCVIGLDVQDNLIYETFYFSKNEYQIGKKHFVKILTILFNDILGPVSKSLNLGGKVIIKEAKPFSLSRDCVMVAQDVEPNLFFRDFFVDGFISLNELLTTALPFYNIDSLGIKTSELDNLVILKNDVTTQIGQKFQATTNNIQKVSLLLSVRNTEEGAETDLAWNGDLVVSIYPLQTDVNCITDFAPNLAIDFQPSNIPVAQLSVNYSTLLAKGTVLDGVPQPVDFVFSNTPIANGTSIISGNYYAVTVKRSGSADKCDLMFAVGSNTLDNSFVTTFTGNLWVSIPDQDLWFQIWTDAAKVSDGQAYDTGYGVQIPKVQQDSLTSANTDYYLGGLQFAGNDTFKAIVQASVEKSVQVQDQRTGNPVYSRQKQVPDIKLYNTLQVAGLDSTADPLFIGAIADKNKKFADSVTSTISVGLHHYGLIEDEMYIKVIDDPTDPRYDTSVNSLVSSILNGDLVGAKIIPNTSSPSDYYRVSDATLCSMIYGDVNGDGVINEQDLEDLNNLKGFDLNSSPPVLTSITTDTYNTTFTNGYTNLTNPFTNAFSVSFQIVDKTTTAVLASGTDGILIVNPGDGAIANFGSASVDFTAITSLSDCYLVILTSSPEENHGGYVITGLDTASDIITIKKLLLTKGNLYNILRSDIDGDMIVTNADGYYLASWIQKESVAIDATTGPYAKIGTKFNVIKIKVEKFVDRNDDYTSSGTRATAIHPVQDIFSEDVGLQAHDFLTTPITSSIEKQFVWYEQNVIYTSKQKLVPAVFTSTSGLLEPLCNVPGVDCESYPVQLDFDPGKIDMLIPNDIILGGNMKNKDGSNYKIDFETGIIVLEIPAGLLDSEKIINIFDNFVCNFDGNGFTRLGYPAMKFADCTFVEPDALSKNQVNFTASVQAFSPEIDGVDSDGYSGPIVDGRVGVYVDYATGLLTIHFTNLYEDPTLQSLSTKIQVVVMLKKGGWNNRPLFVSSTEIKNLLS